MCGKALGTIFIFYRFFGISRRERYTVLTDDQLDEKVREITAGNPALGQRVVQGLLRSEGHIIQRWRVAESLIRVDEAAVAMRWSQVIKRRTYQVPGPNALWHIDGNHKLIRYYTDFCIVMYERNPSMEIRFEKWHPF